MSVIDAVTIMQYELALLQRLKKVCDMGDIEDAATALGDELTVNASPEVADLMRKVINVSFREASLRSARIITTGE